MEKYFRQYGIFQFGASTELCVQTLPLTPPDTQQVLLRVMSTSVNPIDIKTRSGLGYVAAGKLPDAFLPLGYDVLGEVVQVGDDVTRLQPGDTVIGMVGFAAHPGCYATHVYAAARELIKVDQKADVSLSGLCLAGLTAWQALADFEPDNRPVYINAATGGVGHLLLQIGRLRGFEVIPVSRRTEHELFAALGMRAITPTDYLAQPRGGILIDLVGGTLGLQMTKNLLPGSELVTIPTVTKEQILAVAREQQVCGRGLLVEANQTQLAQLYEAVQSGQLKVAVSQQFELSDIQQAHEYLEQGAHCGKVIITA
ncbi:NADP-dependent oxidoreductase [Pseudoalteromonas sp. OOF1S-7]|uniref:NADP-dependent oxidoreductase n=1 Tax=Pseudoalteromonas sp. OOF1S-7 TaxID=2917757 RepID=UPI001EF47504|nr:NADP-dependent oxidoreductase [Pseudoalteromonas sp. OOF1S-7]MCG7533788.1 NADP-dependent oxidoreductase [Pseudoalteromonas sp. OOF1S-7]